MIKIISILSAVIFISSCSNYYNGKTSDHFDGKRFFDPELSDEKTFGSFLKWQFTKKPAQWPQRIEVENYNVPPRNVYGNDLRITNVGHVTFLIQTQGVNILTDPVWSKRASPVTFAGPKRVIDPGIKFEDLPPIDIVWVSHNHYDHLDLPTIQRLWQSHKPRIITPLGNDTIIKSMNPEINVESYDWEDSVFINDNIKLHLSPMQHWSSRNIFDRNKALWAALTIETKGGNIYFVGDSGYGEGRYFKRDKEKFGNYRLAIIPMGAYEPRWFMKYAHMNPEEFVLSHIDLGRPFSVPSHYDVFKLTDEAIGDASKALKEAIQNHKVGDIKELKIGEALMVPK